MTWSLIGSGSVARIQLDMEDGSLDDVLLGDHREWLATSVLGNVARLRAISS